MSKNSLVAYIKLWLLFQLFIEINCQAIPFKPQQRSGHTATLIDNRLYILGGAPGNAVGYDFFYLDVPTSLRNRKPFWIDLSNINVVPPHYGAASVKGGADNNTLFIYGGIGSNGTKMELVYTFDPMNNDGWSIPNIAGANSINKKGYLTGIIDRYGKMYLWGGDNFLGTGFVESRFSNSMVILDTINFSWNVVNGPVADTGMVATLLPDQTIIYFGYFLDKFYLYDTINNTWSNQTTSGETPSANGSRIGFSVVLGLDGQRVILYGGFDNFTEGSFVSYAEGSLYVLNLADFGWYVPKISGRIPSRRFDHKANVIENYMVISFGSGYNQSTESDILLLDISNNDKYTWMDDFNFIIQSQTPYNPPKLSNNKDDKLVMIGTIVGASIGATLLVLGCILLYKWRRDKIRQKKVTPTLGNEEKNNYKNENLIKPNKETNDQGQKEIQLQPIDGQEILQTPENAIIKE